MKKFLTNLILFLLRIRIIRSLFYYLITIKNPFFRYRLADIILLNISENEQKELINRIHNNYSTSYFDHFTNLKNYDDLENFKLKNHQHLEDLVKNNQDSFFIQLGSCTGREIIFFKEKYPSLKCISTDINQKFLDYQEKKYGNKINYAVLDIKNINNFLKKENIIDKKKIIYINGVLNYLNVKEIEKIILKFSEIKNTFYVLNHVVLKGVNSKDKRRLDFFDHNYSELMQNSQLINIYEKNTKLKDLTFNHFGIYKN